jgi:hypothetical protein
MSRFNGLINPFFHTIYYQKKKINVEIVAILAQIQAISVDFLKKCNIFGVYFDKKYRR